jgi:Icc-related predicted phosphoesterase
MKALIVADLHYSLRQFDWLLSVAPDYDLVIIAGDLLDLAGHCDLDVQIVVVAKYLARISRHTRLVTCSGNHDGDIRNEADEHVAEWLQEVREDQLHVDGESVELAVGLVTICPWWDGPVSREAVERMLACVAPRAPDAWIWVYHGPPDQAAVSWTGTGFQGDRFLNRLIERFGPSMVISGHIHSSPFRAGGSWIDRVGETWVLNPGRQLGEVPAFIGMDLAAGCAEWVSAAGREAIDLSDAKGFAPRALESD